MELGKFLGKNVTSAQSSQAKQTDLSGIKKDNSAIVNFDSSEMFHNDNNVEIDNQINFSISDMSKVAKSQNDEKQAEFNAATFIGNLQTFSEKHSKEETYEHFKQELSDLAKKDPEGFKSAVGLMLNLGNSHYDHAHNIQAISDSQADILDKFINGDGEVKGAVCTTIHGFMMDTLHDLGYNAALIQGSEGEYHATMIYQTEDGKYVYNNYGQTMEIEADNIIQATKIAARDSNFDLKGSYVQISGDGSNFYEEYAFKDEAAYGDEVDSKNNNKTTAFKNSKTEGKSGVSATYGRDNNIGQYKLDAKVDYVNEDSQFKISAGVQYRQTEGSTDNFNGATSFGGKVDAAKNFDLGKNGQITTDATVIASNLKGRGTVEDIRKNEYIVIKEQIGASYSKDVYKDNDITLTNAARLSEDVTVGIDTAATVSDLRVQLEDGLKLTKETDNLTVEAIVNAGIMGNMALSDFQNQHYILNIGGKGNIEGNLQYNIDDETHLGFGAGGFVAGDKTHVNYGLNSEITLSKDIINPRAQFSNSQFNAALGYSMERTELFNIGGFNENIQNEHNLYAKAAFDLGEKIDVYGTYNFEITQKRHDFSIGAKINFD